MELKLDMGIGVPIQEDLIGIFFEDINYGADGGIYAEMIENRSFEFLDARGDKDAYYQIFDGLYGWNAINDYAHISIRDESPLNKINPHYLSVQSKKKSGFMNKAYDGILLIKGNSYTISFWAKSSAIAKVKIGIWVNKSCVCMSELVTIDKNDWKRYEVNLTSKVDARHAIFSIVFEEDGEADFDFISMIPNDAVCGLFRKDLVEKLKELKPRFVRFPGGCVVEGNNLENRYQWKLTVGNVEERKSNWNRWAVHENRLENDFCSKYNHYNQTLGLGYYEYFILCEYLEAKALPVVNVGLACQYQSTEVVQRTADAYQQYIQDVLDLIEFANGSIDTKWGSLRAKMGHPDSFGLEMIGIGNEQWQTQNVDFFERYDDFEKAIHSLYPDIKLIGSAGPNVFSDTYDAAWDNYRSKSKIDANFTYAVDEHYYMEPDWFLNHTHFYDNYDRNVKVFAGEYAAHDREVDVPEHKNNWRCALAEAAFLTGVERNADVVYLSSYAPLFARIGYVQWSPDLIWFDDKDCYGTPNFYVQKLFRLYTGKRTIACELLDGDKENVYVAASCDEDDKILYLKFINASNENKTITMDDEFTRKVQLIEEAKEMAGELLQVNSIAQPDSIIPRDITIEDIKNISLKPYSMIVVKCKYV